MTREQFLFQLEQLLLDLPQEEREEALEYYRDYFSDAGSENEASVIAELGTPQKVAASIKEGLRSEGGIIEKQAIEQPPEMRGSIVKSDKQRNTGRTDARSKWILIILVAILTFPVWIGVVGTLFGVLVGAIFAVLGVSIAIVAVAAGGVIGGVVVAIVGIVRLVTGGFASGMITFGVGMLFVALGCLSGVLALLLFGKLIPRLLVGISKLFHNGRPKKKEVGINE